MKIAEKITALDARREKCLRAMETLAAKLDDEASGPFTYEEQERFDSLKGETDSLNRALELLRRQQEVHGLQRSAVGIDLIDVEGTVLAHVPAVVRVRQPEQAATMIDGAIARRESTLVGKPRRPRAGIIGGVVRAAPYELEAHQPLCL